MFCVTLVAEDHRVLRDAADVTPQVGGVERRDVGTVKENAARLRIIEAKQQLEQGGLAGA